MIKVSEKIFENNPGLAIGIIRLENIDNSGDHPEIRDLLRRAEKGLRNDFESEGINNHPHILAWRDAHKKFGNNPKRYAPSVWAVTKRVAKGGELPSINSLVDLYNYICLKYIVPVGGEDLDRCKGEISLAYADGDEKFIEIGGEENNPPEKGEIVYKDEAGVLCRKFNWREADRTKLTKETKNAIIVIETLLPFGRKDLEAAIEEFKDLAKKYCGGSSVSVILEKA